MCKSSNTIGSICTKINRNVISISDPMDNYNILEYSFENLTGTFPTGR